MKFSNKKDQTTNTRKTLNHTKFYNFTREFAEKMDITVINYYDNDIIYYSTLLYFKIKIS